MSHSFRSPGQHWNPVLGKKKSQLALNRKLESLISVSDMQDSAKLYDALHSPNLLRSEAVALSAAPAPNQNLSESHLNHLNGSIEGESQDGLSPVEVFVSYSHVDDDLRSNLVSHLRLSERLGEMSIWYDRKMHGGERFSSEIEARLKRAEIVLLLVSDAFLDSDYCYKTEMTLAMERHEAGETQVLPIILRDCDWEGAPFSALNMLPTDGKAVMGSAWKTLDEALTVVAKGVRRVALDIRSGQ